jgi:hypothetical protein
MNITEASEVFTRAVIERKQKLRFFGVPEDQVLADVEYIRAVFKAEIDARAAKLIHTYRIMFDPEDGLPANAQRA